MPWRVVNWENKSLVEILANVSKLPVAVRNNEAGIFPIIPCSGRVMGPKGGGILLDLLD